LGGRARHHGWRQVAGGHPFHATPFLDPARQVAGMAAKVKNVGESAPHVVKPVEKPLRNFAKQKIMRVESPGGAIPMLTNQIAVKEVHFAGHNNVMACLPIPKKGKPLALQEEGVTGND